MAVGGQTAFINEKDACINRLVRARRIPLLRPIPGNDSISAPVCILSPSICDICAHFVASSLYKTGTEHLSSRWVEDKIGLCDGKREKRGGRNIFKHYSSFVGLTGSAKAGCPLCRLLVHVAEQAEDFRSGSSHVFECVSRVELTSKRPCSTRLSSDGGPVEYIEFDIRPVIGQEYAPFRGLLDLEYSFVLAQSKEDCMGLTTEHWSRLPSLSFASDENFYQIGDWRVFCVPEHQRRHRERVPYPWPKKLLDVAPRLPDKVDYVVLVDTDGQDPIQDTNSTLYDVQNERSVLWSQIAYAAISYRHGEKENPRVAKITGLDSQHQPDIPTKNLYRGVQDAVQLCRDLCLRYLWVDLLCLCLDDQEDKVATTDEITNAFSHCQLAISPPSDLDMYKGFLTPKDLKPIGLGNVELSYGTWTNYKQLYIRKVHRDLLTDLSLTPSYQQVIAMYESSLAPAVLHYGRDQVIWECCSMTASETGAYLNPAHRATRLVDVERPPTEHVVPVPRNDPWENIVSEFSAIKSKELPHRNQLLEIGLFARYLRFQNIYHGRYAAGLWESDLDYHLMWRLSYSHILGKHDARKPPYVDPRIPSWSWAHCGSQVELNTKWPGSASATIRSARFHFSDPAEEILSTETVDAFSGVSVVLRTQVQKMAHSPIKVHPASHFDGREEDSLPGTGSELITDYGRYSSYSPSPSSLSLFAAAMLTNYEGASYLVLEKIMDANESSCETPGSSETSVSETLGRPESPSALPATATAKMATATTTEQRKDGFTEERLMRLSNLGTVYKRIGVLHLKYRDLSDDDDGPDEPGKIPDISFRDCAPLLTEGKVQDIVLI